MPSNPFTPGDLAEWRGSILKVYRIDGPYCDLAVRLGAFERVDSFDLSGPIPDGFRPMSSAPKVHMQKILLFAADFGVVTGWWDAEIANFWSKRQHPDNPPIPPLGDWCCDEADTAGSGDKRMICGFTPKAWKALP